MVTLKLVRDKLRLIHILSTQSVKVLLGLCIPGTLTEYFSYTLSLLKCYWVFVFLAYSQRVFQLHPKSVKVLLGLCIPGTLTESISATS